MRPQDGYGSGTPRPRNDSVASTRMALPSCAVHSTMNGPIVLGRMCRNAMRRWRTPSARAASTYCISRIDSTLARMTRAARGMIGTEIAMTTLWTAGPERGRHHQGEHQQRQPLQDVEHPLGDQVGLAADVADRSPMMPPSTEPSSVDATPDDERDPRAVHDAAVDVAAEVVGAQPVLGARARRACRRRRWRWDRGWRSRLRRRARSP